MIKTIKDLIQKNAEEEMFDEHGCLTGDCPHEKQRDCFIEIHKRGASQILKSLPEIAKNKYTALKIVEEWQQYWMFQKQNSPEDHENYFRRAFGIDANMRHHLAKLFSTFIGAVKSEVALEEPKPAPRMSEDTKDQIIKVLKHGIDYYTAILTGKQIGIAHV